MFENCTVKYGKDMFTDENAVVKIIYTDGSHRELHVPMDNENTDYQEVLAWVAAGNTIEEAD
tara:strand:- start:6 stop:191 length:186 start_codon:yes stop_codon:yes gene_type:complete